jgi:hypothetical protein
MREKIQNALSVEVTGADLTKATKLQFWLKQGELFFEYTPQVVDQTHLLVVIPFADAMQLDPGKSARLQLALTDADGNPQAADIVSQLVKDLLKEAGYD